MTTILKKFFPWLAPSTHIVLGFCYDIFKYLQTATDFGANQDKKKLRALLIRQFHGVEKALSLPQPRLGFGAKLIDCLTSNLLVYYEKYGYDSLVKTVTDTLFAYKEFNNIFTDEKFQNTIMKVDQILGLIREYDNSCEKSGGCERIFKNDILSVIKNTDFEKFCKSRVSVRDFAQGEVAIENIHKAIEIACKSPSACNRQPWRVHLYKNEKKKIILELQNGHRGFSDSIDTILLITGLNSSFSYSERHAVWVDGGLFSMSLIYALHSLGIGVCPLNTSYTFKQERQIRRILSLPVEEEPILMLAVGLLKDEFIATKSWRKPLQEILVLE